MNLVRSLLRLVVLTLVAILAPVGVMSATASPLMSASGDFQYTGCAFNPRSAGSNTIIDTTCAITYTGTVTGTSIQQGTLIIHADGATNFHGFETFTGAVNRVWGTVTFNEASPGSSTSFQSTDVITHGTGGLTNLHGVLTVFGTVPPPPPILPLPYGTYSGQIHVSGP